MRYQGYSYPTGDVEEMESSSYVEIDRSNPAFYIDCSNLPSLTRQEYADECDINKLMAQYEKTGILPVNTNTGEPRYLDVSDVPDLMQAHAILNEATISFMALPATIRRDFDNDPMHFIAFCENPDNLDKLREWKLAPPAPVEPPPAKVEITNADILSRMDPNQRPSDGSGPADKKR